MRAIPVAAVALALDVASARVAHEAPTHEHAGLVPVPEYDPPFGKAGAAASLQAAEVLPASFDESTRA